MLRGYNPQNLPVPNEDEVQNYRWAATADILEWYAKNPTIPSGLNSYAITAF